MIIGGRGGFYRYISNGDIYLGNDVFISNSILLQYCIS